MNTRTQFPRSRIIVQAHLHPFLLIKDQLPYFKRKGFTDILISPVQTHCAHIDAWYRVYQPTGCTIGNSLGTEEDLQSMVSAAKELNIGILVDVVLHHLTGCPICNPQSIFFIGRKIKSWCQYLFQAMRGSTLVEENSRFCRPDWGPPCDFTDQRVLDRAVKFLSYLLEMGVSGFRFDAAKHMYPKQVKTILEKTFEMTELDPTNILVFCEVIDADNSVYEEYLLTNEQNELLCTVTDFSRTFSIQSALQPGNDLRHGFSNVSWFSAQSVTLADSHDSMEGNSYTFFDEREGVLILGMLLSSGIGIPMVYFSFLNDQLVLSGVQFYHLNFGRNTTIAPHSTSDLLFIQRGENALAIVNKSNEFIVWNAFQVSLNEGLYHELHYGFDVQVSLGGDGNKWIQEWGEPHNGGLKIGPRDILFLVLASDVE